jgi:hypothetical protein
MDAAVFRDPRRRFIPIASRAGAGEMAVLEFGPADRPVDVIFVHANGCNGQSSSTRPRRTRCAAWCCWTR